MLLIKLLCDQENVETGGVGLHLWIPVSQSQDRVSDKGRSGSYALWISSRNTLRQRQRESDKEGSANDKTPLLSVRGLLLYISRNNCLQTLADNPACLEYTLGEPADLVFSFVGQPWLQ